MYTEEYERRGFPLRNFILKLILVIIFVFLLIWLLPKFISPVINKNNSNNGSNCSNGTCEIKGLSALTSQIFADNLDRMKEAAIAYYTTDRLPKNVGEYNQMTLSDMIGKKIITPLIDKNNKACDVEKSYVKITKLADEYILKVNLKDSEKEDYILVHLGCYSYCEKDICQKKTDVPVKGSTVNPYVPIKGTIEGGIYTPPEDPTPVVPENPKCAYKGGKYYDKDGQVATEAEFKRSCGIVDPHYCVIYEGKFYDRAGNVVSEQEYKVSCGIEDHHYCVFYNNKYYDKDGNVVSEADYKKSCGIEDPHYCVFYDGKYYDKNGKVVTEAEYKKSCEAEKEYVYEYQKVVPAKVSEWSPWTEWSKTDCATQEVNCNEQDLTCLAKLQIYKRKEKIGTYDRSYAKQRDVVVQTGSYKQIACSKYNYVIINRRIYATTTTTTYTQVNTITATTVHSWGGWVYNGRASYSNPPSDGASTHYEFVGADYSACGESCTTLPNYYYDSYTYTGGLDSVTSTTVTPGEITSTTETSEEVTTETEASASCGEYVYKTIPIYGTITVTEKATRTEPLYGDVCYQSTKARSILESERTELKWSKYNDKSLLDAGWTYTGNKKLK